MRASTDFIPMVRILMDRRLTDQIQIFPVQPVPKPPHELRRWRRVPLAYGHLHPAGGEPRQVHRGPFRQQLIENDAKRIDICVRSHAAFAHLFGGSVGKR